MRIEDFSPIHKILRIAKLNGLFRKFKPIVIFFFFKRGKVGQSQREKPFAGARIMPAYRTAPFCVHN